MIQNGQAEIRALKHEREQALAMGASGETASLRITADALEERVAMLERQLAAADQENRELKALQVLKSLPADSLENVIQMAKAA